MTALAYANIFSNNFVGDDKDFIFNWNSIKSTANLSSLVAGDLPVGHEGVYRPVRSLAYLGTYQLWQTNPIPYHVFSLAIHLSITFLVFVLTLQVTNNKSISIVTTLLFGLHPIHTEAVTFITASFDTLSFLFLFISLTSYISSKKSPHPKRLHQASLAFGLLAAFTNETALIIPLLILLYETLFSTKSNSRHSLFKTTTPFFLIFLTYVVVRVGILELTTRQSLFGYDPLINFFISLKALLLYTKLLIAPIGLSLSHTLPGGIDTYSFSELNRKAALSQNFLEPSFLIALVYLLSLITTVKKYFTKKPIISFAITWSLISFIPIANLFPGAAPFTERYVYLASYGFCLSTALIIFYLSSALKKSSYRRASVLFPIFLTTAISIFYVQTTFKRNLDWRNETILWEKTAQTSPNNPVVLFQLAKVYQINNQPNKAITQYQSVIRIAPSFVAAHHNTGNIFQFQGNFDSAIASYKQALHHNPNHQPSKDNLTTTLILKATQLVETGQSQGAASLLKQALQLSPANSTANFRLETLCKTYQLDC